MGCNANANARTVELPKELTIYGHILDTSTRSLKMSCEISGKKFKFVRKFLWMGNWNVT
jgi:hypothetical protein